MFRFIADRSADHTTARNAQPPQREEGLPAPEVVSQRTSL